MPAVLSPSGRSRLGTPRRTNSRLPPRSLLETQIQQKEGKSFLRHMKGFFLQHPLPRAIIAHSAASTQELLIHSQHQHNHEPTACLLGSPGRDKSLLSFATDNGFGCINSSGSLRLALTPAPQQRAIASTWAGTDPTQLPNKYSKSPWALESAYCSPHRQ